MTPVKPPRPHDPSSVRVQSARGLACLLLVTYHVIGTDPQSGIHADDESLYRYFTDLFLPIRMPLFTFLSGFVYVYKPMVRTLWRDFARRKLLRLGVPLLVASTVTFLSLMAHSYLTQSGGGIAADLKLSSLWKIYVFPLKHLWFLQTLLSVMAIVMVMEAARLLATLERFLIVFAIAMLAFATSPLSSVRVFSLHQVTYLLPFFLLGIGANRFRDVLQSRAVMTAVASLFAVALVTHAIEATFGHFGVSERTDLVSGALAISAVLCIVRWMPSSRFLRWIGTFSFSIYLYHLALILFVSLTAEQLGVRSKPLLLLLGLTGGMLLPVLLERAARHNGTAHFLLLGQKLKSKPPVGGVSLDDTMIGEGLRSDAAQARQTK